MLLGIYYVVIICSDYLMFKWFYIDVLGFLVIDENYWEVCNLYKCDLGLLDGM